LVTPSSTVGKIEPYARVPGAEQLDTRPFDADLARMKDELSRIVTWATKTLAHLDPRLPEDVPRFDECARRSP
jgi:hypothetical protein